MPTNGAVRVRRYLLTGENAVRWRVATMAPASSEAESHAMPSAGPMVAVVAPLATRSPVAVTPGAGP